MSDGFGSNTDTAPVALFVYNRVDHAAETLSALRLNDQASETDLYVFCDGPKSEADREKVNSVGRLVADIDGFRSVSVVARDTNIGLAQSIIEGVTEVVERHERIIVIEDDLVTHPGTLTYFNRMLKRFTDHAGVFSISAYSHPAAVMRVPDDYEYDVYAIPRMQCCGWATWRDRWKKADFSVADFETFNASPTAVAAFTHWIGADCLRTLRACMRGEKDVWACRWAYTHFKHHAVCICPTRSLVDNIGLDGSGSNCGMRTDLKNDLQASDVSDWRLPTAASIDPRIFESFMSVTNRVRKPTQKATRTPAHKEPPSRLVRPSLVQRAAYWSLRPRELLRRVRERAGLALGVR